MNWSEVGRCSGNRLRPEGSVHRDDSQAHGCGRCEGGGGRGDKLHHVS